MKTETILSFVMGMATGGMLASAGLVYHYKKKQKNLEERLFDMETYYNETNPYRKESLSREAAEKEEDSLEEGEVISNTGRERGVLSTEERNNIKERLRKNYEGTTAYASMYRPKMKPKEEDPAIYEHPLEEDDIREFEETIEQSDPVILTNIEVGELPNSVTQTCLFWFECSDVVTNEEKELVDNVELLLGNKWKDAFDEEAEDSDVIFVMNYGLNTCFEVQRLLQYEDD